MCNLFGHRETNDKPVTKSKPFSYKVGKGFSLASADEKFQLSLGARLQSRYTFNENETAPNASEFRVRRMKLFMTGHVYSKDLTYKLQVNFADSGKLLEDAWLNYRFADEAQLLFGQEKVQFARQDITSSGTQQFVDRSNATETFKVGRYMGAMLHGKVAKGLATYNLGIYGGVGQNTVRTTDNNSLPAGLTGTQRTVSSMRAGEVLRQTDPFYSSAGGHRPFQEDQ